MKITKKMLETVWPEIPLINPKSRPPSTHKRVYRQGRQIVSIAEFAEWLFSNNGWVFLKGKAYHPGWAMGWSLRFVLNAITGHGIYKAVKK